MPFKIVRNDITKMNTEAIVNTANDHVSVGSGCDSAVYKAAGVDTLLKYREEKIGFAPEREGGFYHSRMIMKNKKKQIKAKNMTDLYEYHQYLRNNPKLAYLFIELTNACNLNCIHCGSNSSDKNKGFIDTGLLLKTLDDVADDFDPGRVMICLSGGEPFLHPDFFIIAKRIVELGFPWGITTNATKIDESTVQCLKDLKLSSITVSLDGLEETHNRFRRSKTAFSDTVKSIGVLNKFDIDVQVTSVIHSNNYSELEEMYDLVCKMHVKSWRLVNIEPIGRALNQESLMLKKEQISGLLEFVREKRFGSRLALDVTFGCSHYLSFEYEHEVRDNYFLCGSGIFVASILYNGDIYSCLDIERRKELVQGNIRTDRFSSVWFNGFKEFREDRTEKNKDCLHCNERFFCFGDSTHTWDFDSDEPRFCIFNYIDKGGVISK